MNGLPAIVNLRGRRCVVIGGGKTALRRSRTLLEAEAQVRVVAPRFDPAFEELAAELVPRYYQSSDLDQAWLVVAATDDSAVNQRVAEDARQRGALVNRTDGPSESDLVIPARGERGPVTLTVHTAGISANAATRIRDELLEKLDPDWPRLLEIAQPYRGPIQQRYAESGERQAKLRQLTDAEAMRILKHGGDQALRDYFESLT